jgi:penicillin-binding protein 1A
LETKAERYYPTYISKERDILLIEFEEAQKIANSQTTIYGQVTNILLAVATITFSFLLDGDKEKTANVENLFHSNSILFSIILFLFGAILLRYFVDLQKQITVNARKVVTLRTLLGLDYGRIHLTLPNWSVEGATNPFAIKYFYGWFNFKSMPFWLLTITINCVWYISTRSQNPITLTIFHRTWTVEWAFFCVIITLFYLWVFRTFLYDRHETTYLNICRSVCTVLGIQLLENFEYILYRAKLSYLELDRLRLNYSELKEILIEIEEARFHDGRGFSIRALVRGLLSRFKFFRKKYGYIPNGGSTITMQLSRTLFIPSQQNKYLRKLVEIMLSLWLNQQFDKEEILKLYVGSVRFERGIYGLGKATRYFFGKLRDKSLTKEESFFLVERLGNINSKVHWNRIIFLNNKLPHPIDRSLLEKLYLDQITRGRLKQ